MVVSVWCDKPCKMGTLKRVRLLQTANLLLSRSKMKLAERGSLKNGEACSIPLLSYSPHIPRRGAPQGQGPDSHERTSLDVPETANTESSFSTCGLEQLLHRISSFEEYVIFSNLDPQFRHWYSKIGIFILLIEYSQAYPGFQLLSEAIQLLKVIGLSQRCCSFLADCKAVTESGRREYAPSPAQSPAARHSPERSSLAT